MHRQTTRLRSSANGAVSVDDAPGAARSLLLHRLQLGQRLYIQSIVRFLVAAAIVVGAAAAKHVVGIQDLDAGNLTALACLLALFNVNVFVIARRFRTEEEVAASYRFLQVLMHITIDVDFLFLTVGLWLVGGPKSPFQAFYLVHVILAAILLSPRAAYLHTLFGYGLLSALVLGEWFDIIPTRMPLGAVNSTVPLDGRFVVTVLAVQGFLMTLSVSLGAGLARLLREGEQRLREANAQLEHAAAMRRDFFHIVLHDLKSPVSSAAMILHSMTDDPEAALTERQVHWVERLRVRLQEAMTLLRDFDVMAALDGDVIEKNRKPVDMAQLIKRVVEQHAELVEEHKHTLRVEVEKDLPRVNGVERLLHEALSNFVSNAVKYTPVGGRIILRARISDGAVRVEVEDNGIGISPEDQKRLFREFVRVRRSPSPDRQPTGSGLGLSIARRIVEAHGGRVGAVSELDKGSIFYMELPIAPSS